MLPAAPPARPSRRGLALRTGLAASLVLGVVAALPGLAAEAAYTDTSGRLEVPAAGVASGDLVYDFATCPAPPPTQGVDVWAYELPADVALPGAPLAVTGTDAAGAVDLFAYVYKADCTYDRLVESATPEEGVAFPLADGDRYLTVATPTGAGTDLVLTVGAPTSTPTLPPTPSAEPGPGGEPGTSGPVVRRDYSGGVDDPLYPEQGTGPASLEFSGQWGMRLVQAEQAWQEPRATGAGITVAVLDSGLDVTHPDFACEGKVVRLDPARYPRFADVKDVEGHGTHVAGTIGACTDNGTGVVGVAPDSRILPVQALSPTEATGERLAAAIDAAVESGAHVINMSLGFSAAGAPGTGSALALVGGFAADIDPAIERAVAAGVVVVAAAGNESVPLCGYPAIAADVVCVGATDRRDLNTWYGNFPVTPVGAALVAPGGSGTLTQLDCTAASEGVLSTFSRDAEFPCDLTPGYNAIDGTSMATPHVAGVAALVYDRLGGVRSPEAAQQVIAAMTSSAKDLYTPGYDPMSGEGRIDALAAVRAVTPVTDPTGTPSPTTTPTQEPSPTPTQTEAPPLSPTTAELLAASQAQTTDELPVAVRLEDEQGPVEGADVVFRLRGDGGVRDLSAVTDERGVATAVQSLDVLVGSYVLSVEYAGDDRRLGSYAEQSVEVVRDDSATSVTSSGRGAGRTVTARVLDADDATRPLAYREVVFLADGKQVGSASTDGSGVAVFSPTGSARGAKQYEARFDGDDRYEASSGRATP